MAIADHALSALARPSLIASLGVAHGDAHTDIATVLPVGAVAGTVGMAIGHGRERTADLIWGRLHDSRRRWIGKSLDLAVLDPNDTCPWARIDVPGRVAPSPAPRIPLAGPDAEHAAAVFTAHGPCPDASVMAVSGDAPLPPLARAVAEIGAGPDGEPDRCGGTPAATEPVLADWSSRGLPFQADAEALPFHLVGPPAGARGRGLIDTMDLQPGMDLVGVDGIDTGPCDDGPAHVRETRQRRVAAFPTGMHRFPPTNSH